MKDAPLLPKLPAIDGWDPKWSTAALIGGMIPALIGAGGYFASLYGKGKRMTMSKIERTALALLGALIDKVQELEKDNVQLSRRAVDAEMQRDAEKARTDKAQEQLTEVTDQLSKLKIQIESLEEELTQIKQRRARRQR